MTVRLLIAIVTAATCLAPALAAAQPEPAAAPPAPSPPPDDDALARQQFDTLFGGELAQVLNTRETLDDAELAAKMLRSVRGRPGNPHFAILVCRQVVELGKKHPSGYLSAILAMEQLERLVPERADQYQEEILALHEQMYSRTRGEEHVQAGRGLIDACIRYGDRRMANARYDDAANLYRRALAVMGVLRTENSYSKDEIQAKLQDALARSRASEQAGRLRAQLLANPQDKAAREELVRLYVVELDDLQEAAKVAPEEGPTQNYVLVAAMTVERLPEAACLALGEWYRGFAEKAGAPARPRVLARAAAYYEAFLARHPGQDEPRAKAAAALDAVDQELDRLAAQGALAAPVAKIVLVNPAVFAERYAARFPPTGNVARGGKATPSSQYVVRDPNDVFGGARTGHTWTLAGPKGQFDAVWNPPVRGRYLLLFNRSSSVGADTWGKATLSLNGGPALAIGDFSGTQILVADFGISVVFRSLRITIDGQMFPGMAGLEIHR